LILRSTAVDGGSYGGYAVNAVLADFSGNYIVGISLYGAADWVTKLKNASLASKHPILLNILTLMSENSSITIPNNHLLVRQISSMYRYFSHMELWAQELMYLNLN
jgi:hypothetical protein